jgi:hypothetical protein
MEKTFIESREFTEWVEEYLTDECYSELQRHLLHDPESGAVISGCGGLRKIRVADPRRGKGKRSGIRVIYLHVAEAHVIFLLDVYDKNERDDLTADQTKLLKKLADEYKRAAVKAAGVSKRQKP